MSNISKLNHKCYCSKFNNNKFIKIIGVNGPAIYTHILEKKYSSLLVNISHRGWP